MRYFPWVSAMLLVLMSFISMPRLVYTGPKSWRNATSVIWKGDNQTISRGIFTTVSSFSASTMCSEYRAVSNDWDIIPRTLRRRRWKLHLMSTVSVGRGCPINVSPAPDDNHRPSQLVDRMGSSQTSFWAYYHQSSRRTSGTGTRDPHQQTERICARAVSGIQEVSATVNMGIPSSALCRLSIQALRGLDQRTTWRGIG